MKTPYFTVKDIIQITGITKRALHYYDRTDLLKPSKVEDNGYRYYDQEALGNLQMILLFKEMNFSLKDIAAMMQLSKDEQKDILREHRSTLVQRKQKLETIIDQLDEYVDGTDISHLNLFDDSPILSIQEQYDSEAKFVYGDTQKYQEFEANVSELSAEEQGQAYQQFLVNMEQVFQALAKHQDLSPASGEVQALVGEWKSSLEQFMVCDAEILRCIAEVYTTDRRYVSYFDQFGDENFLRFLYRAIMVYVEGEEVSAVKDVR
ncbi:MULTISPECIES: MerR family transcriptional regulator [unclassified Paenibacillus]|uniref:MerR family transcriptional regulator n=1 Tax=unclassified Paenibacillus TaxID=185978 RepID=UPI00040778B7|nr:MULTISPECIES: MerR family transcriptional regulator [unclassified Paenibacillus]KGP84605.1 MerR family transcriptional regulator [Paenibacillus sp. MAEPY2]KGP86772.1 MerR family transcriptional regulator [Paenibacillus sp. MAEPY1]